MKYTHIKTAMVKMVLAGAAFLPLTAHGFVVTARPKTIAVTSLADTEALVSQIVGVMQTILFAVAAIFVVIAGYQYLTAQGDPEKTANARNVLIYAIIAVGIGILATILKALVLNFLKAG